VPAPAGDVPVLLSRPPGDGPWPGVVVVHDAVGMTSDLVHQNRWLAESGFVAAAPDLLRGGTIGRCLRDIVRDYSRWEGSVFDQIEAVRVWLAGRDDCTGRVGVIGFCLGGGFALALAPGGGFAAASANYGRLPANAEQFLVGACPVVASYGGRDRSLRGAAGTLRRSLDTAGVVNDVHEYPDAGHGFMNQYAPGELPIIFQALGRVLPTGYHEPSARDARRRIAAFFTEHLGDGGRAS
jgi:carboxymethylenebutenolidase